MSVLRSVNKYPITPGTTRTVISIVDEVLSLLDKDRAASSPAKMNLIVTVTAKIPVVSVPNLERNVFREGTWGL